MTVAPLGASAFAGIGAVETAGAVSASTGAAPVTPSAAPAGPTAAEELSRGSFRDAFSVPRTGDADAIGGRIMQHLDRIETHRKTPATGGAPASDPSEASFRRHMTALEKSFTHAIEVELASKTSTSLAGSMNKLMSGN